MRLRITLVFLLLSALAFAQASGGASKGAANKDVPQPAAVPARSTAPPSAAANAAPPMPKPDPEMEKITKMFTGRWDVEEDYADSPMSPGGGKGKGVSMSHPGPGNLSVITDYRTVSSIGVIGHGVLSWSPREKVYVSYWIDNGSPGGSIATGHWKGDDLVFDSVEDMGGQKIQFRMTYTDFRPDSYTLLMDTAPEGKTTFTRMMTFKYTRYAGMMGPHFGPRPMRGATPPPGGESVPPTPREKPKL